ncbi:CD15/CS22/SEF14 family fimbrial major subunit [Enterobacter bugandensis]|uniref:CD15/CS22/SEF14 family fimbrial major subunit n=1 Tax=Enterobacter asburiae TaxID=61645 RepID=UPI0018C2C5AD|nr:CD15/CS22/SEF14 family fimbrial major subunit [Enterobacter asburiae]MBF9773470.1 CD15/CS22/SEF14 family fimbrial major subunit [Enterobacter asburiae]
MIKKLVFGAFIATSLSSAVWAASDTPSSTVNAAFSVTQQGNISANWTPSGTIATNAISGSSLGTLNISFSGGNTVTIKGINNEMPGLFTWVNEQDHGEKIYAKAFYKGNTVEMDDSGEAVIHNLNDADNITVDFKKSSDMKNKAGNYTNTLSVNLYTL